MLVDDHGIMRDGIKALLQRNPEFIIAGEVGSGEECLRVYNVHKPDLVVMDIGLPGLDGIDITAELKRRHPAAKVLILSMYDDDYTVFRAIQAGARGFALKRASDIGDLRDALQTVASGGFYLGSCVPDKLFGRIQASGAQNGANLPLLERLSARERQVFRLIAEGKTSKEVATFLNLTVQTIRSYRKTLMSKLEVHNVASITKLALACGLVNNPASASEDEGQGNNLPHSRRHGPIR